MQRLFLLSLASIVTLAGGSAIAQPALSGAAAPEPVSSVPPAVRGHRAHLDPAEREARRRALFDRLDADHSGTLTYAEFTATRRSARAGHAEGSPLSSLNRPPLGGSRATRLDADGDGTVTREEYTAAMMQRFDRLDANHDGRITPDERNARRRGARAVGESG